MKECPICEQKGSYVGDGTCCNCGYNFRKHEFVQIKVNIKDIIPLLKHYEDIQDLITNHYNFYKKH